MAAPTGTRDDGTWGWPVPALAIASIVGQAVFALAWLIAGGLDAGYSHEQQFVSELGADDAKHAWIANIGIVALGLSWVAIGLALRLALSGRPRSSLPGALFIMTGLAAILAAVFPVDCSSSVDDTCRTLERGWDLSWHHYAHGFLAWAGQLILAATPFTLALALRPGRLARVAVMLGLIGLVIGAAQLGVQLADEDRAGIYQRAGLVIGQGWTCLIAGALLLVSAVLPAPAVRDP